MRLLMRCLSGLAIWAVSLVATALPCSGSAPPVRPTNLLSGAARSRHTVVRRWRLARGAAFDYPAGTRLLLYNSGEARLMTVNGQGGRGNGAVSPDGKWLLFAPTQYDEALFAPLTGGRVLLKHCGPVTTGPHDVGYWGDSVWMPTGERWVRVFRSFEGIRAVVQSLRVPQKRHVVPLGIPAGTYKTWGDLRCDLVGALDSGHLLALAGVAADEYGRGPTRVHLFSFSVAGGSADVRPYDVLLPSRTDVTQVALSPAGDRLAWLVAGVTALPGAPFPARYPRYLMVSRVDGTRPRVVGWFPTVALASAKAAGPQSSGPRSTAPPDVGPQSLMWLADGRRVRFLFEHSLWTVNTGVSRTGP